MPTLEEIIAARTAELAQVSAAITAVYGGQEYEIKDGQSTRRLKRADLKVLLARRSELETEISRLGGGGVSFGVPVDSPRSFIIYP